MVAYIYIYIYLSIFKVQGFGLGGSGVWSIGFGILGTNTGEIKARRGI